MHKALVLISSTAIERETERERVRGKKERKKEREGERERERKGESEGGRKEGRRKKKERKKKGFQSVYLSFCVDPNFKWEKLFHKSILPLTRFLCYKKVS
jgi:hypothetical protein